MSRLTIWNGVLLSAALSTAAAAAPPDDGLMRRVTEAVEAARGELIAIHRDLHRHPEVAGQEVRTAGVVADRLRSLGLEVETGVGGHGVVGVLRGGRPGPVVALRADMDAVASAAPDPVEYRSETPGVRHICGHDVHTTVALGVAEGLAAIRDEMPGTLKLLFQPAEENAEGAKAMVDDGAMVEPAPQAVFAFHTGPLPVGKVASRAGLLLPPTTFLQVVLRAGDDEASEVRSPDLRSIATTLVGELQALTTVGPPADPAGLSVIEGIPLSGDFVVTQPFSSQAGPEPAQWTLLTMIRTSSEEGLVAVKERVAAVLDRVDLDGVDLDATYDDRAIPGAHNDSKLVRAADETFRALLGPDAVVRLGGAVPFFGEDFGHFAELAPTAMYFLGVSNPETGTVGLPHSPAFVADEAAILVGARGMSGVLLSYLAETRDRSEPAG